MARDESHLRLGIVSHPTCRGHEMGYGHPESPARRKAIDEQLLISGLSERCRYYEATQVTREQLLRVHVERYVDALFRAAPRQGLIDLDADTAMNPYTLQAALHAAGACVMGVDLVMRGEVDKVFCNVRPPGHHAERGRAMGFCFFNNVAVGVRHALDVHGVGRAAIIDFDVHHCNGTEDAFRDEPRLLLCSTFQHPFYPYGDPASLVERIVKVPLPAHTAGEAFREAVTTHFVPALARFKPEFIFVSAGFDAHRDDPLAQLALLEDDYAWLGAFVRKSADEYAAGRVVATLEGGYDLDALGRSVVAFLAALVGE